MAKDITNYKTVTKKVPKLTPAQAEAVAKYGNTNGGKPIATKTKKR